jgi:hypothetical protein
MGIINRCVAGKRLPIFSEISEYYGKPIDRGGVTISIFKKRHIKEYDLSIIRNITVEKQHGNANYIILLKQHSGKDIYLPSPHYCGDILKVDAEAQKIRDFLGFNLKSIR